MRTIICQVRHIFHRNHVPSRRLIVRAQPLSLSKSLNLKLLPVVEGRAGTSSDFTEQ
jgi:hypothetical protein